MTAPLPIETFTMWLAQGERGISSETIVSRLTGIPLNQFSTHNYPHDPDDFRRCELLLRAVPLARLHLPAMEDVSPQWARLVGAWDELVALMESEVPDVFTTRYPRGSAPKTYRRMRQLIEQPNLAKAAS